MKNHANMPAAQSTATRFAADTLRSLKSDSGISGARTRDSMTRNATSSATAAPSFDSVATVVQPVSLPLTMA
jgi:hypothetical protein